MQAQFDQYGGIIVTRDDGSVIAVPNDMENTDRKRLAKSGIKIAPYKAPVPPTNADRIDAAFPDTDSAMVIFEALFELANDVRGLKGQQPITRAQLKEWLKAKLPQ